MEWLADPQAWVALATLAALEIVLGVDNIIFISILCGRLPENQREKARTVGLLFAMLTRIGLLFTLSWMMTLTAPLFGIMGKEISGRDVILIGGGLFLVWKATKEIHHNVDPDPGEDMFSGKVVAGFGAAIVQILVLDMVFSVDSIITAVGMTKHITIMVIAVLVTVAVMLVAATPLANFIHNNPSIVMLALAFLLMIGMTLIAEGFHAEVPKGYVYAAMAFSALVEGLNMLSRRARVKREGEKPRMPVERDKAS